MMEAHEVLDFWFKESEPKQWFAQDDAFDAKIRTRFESVYTKASNGDLDDWSASPLGALALVIILDQFSRNLHRNSPYAYALDEKALEIARTVIAKGLDKQLPSLEMRKFLYMPFMHSEDLRVQDEGLLLFETLNDPGTMKFALEHREEIAHFGRFRSRDKALGRTSFN